MLLSIQRVDQLRGRVWRKAPFAERDHAMFVLQHHTGLALAQLVGLNVGDVSQQGKPRHQLELDSYSLPLSVPAQEAIARILAFNDSQGYSSAGTAPLLLTPTRERLSVRAVEKLVECLRQQVPVQFPTAPKAPRLDPLLLERFRQQIQF